MVDMMGLIVLLIAKKRVQIKIQDVSTSFVKAGVANTTGNKGAVMIRFQLQDTSFVFVNNHLASGSTKSNEIDRAKMLEYVINQGYKQERGT